MGNRSFFTSCGPAACPQGCAIRPPLLDKRGRSGYTGSGQGGNAVKVEIQIDPELEEPVLVLRVPAPTEEAEQLAARLRGEAPPQPFTVYDGREAVRVSRSKVLRFFAEDKGVVCQTGKGVFAVRQRLYELEEALTGTKFVRVSNSEIVNLDRVTGLDLTLAGTIKMTLEGGTVCWVSRRYVKKIKQALEL